MSDRRVKHNYFGVAAGFSRFLPVSQMTDSLPVTEAWCKLNTRSKRSKASQKLKLFYGNAATATFVSLKSGEQVIATDSLFKGGHFHIKQFDLPDGVSDLTLHFRGKDSPDVYGLSLEGQGGILVDNFGLRGSSGTFFNKINRGQLQAFYDHFRVRLIILQFGGNTLPYMKTEDQAKQYGRILKAQINTLRRLVPDASFLVLGPSDMSVKEGTTYVTHPLLPSLRDAIKQAAFQTNCSFFDVYEAMGGHNSMVSWVEAGLASKDYIHFLPGGASKIATILYAALLKDYNSYVQNPGVCSK
jgi:lysophospholipase L1-like esterase